MTVPTSESVFALLHDAQLTDLGRIPGASNDTRLVLLSAGQTVRRAVYKPVSGERPLHDFPSGSLAAREVAAGILDAALGFSAVPPTVTRTQAPLGIGSLQIYAETEPDAPDHVGVFPPDELPAGWLPVFAAETEDGAQVVVAHSPDDQLRRTALLDVLANNADRKASHLVTGSWDYDQAPRLFAIDNGLTFHVEDKLRTVLWGFAGDDLRPEELQAVSHLLDSWFTLADSLAPLLSSDELQALHTRVRLLAETRVFPLPPADRYPIPWPPL